MRTPANIREYEYQKAKKRSIGITIRRELVTQKRMLKNFQEELIDLKHANKQTKEKGIINANKRLITVLHKEIRDRKEIIKDTKESLKKLK
jgi:hypothetical protein